ncbi:hypothetical protein AB0J90_24645 [Micromonospora sp. NPDC049523]|uniref:hypothetical protein n=1 Tax=Micromonospora sp. NPDC049523 TaxID=3155921 RepID=UPI0034334E30
MDVPAQKAHSAPFSTPVYTPARTLSDTTRYLCAAAYLHQEFGEAAIQEVLEDERRAVAPSFGFDLDPVVRHCLRARRLMLARDLRVTGLVIAGLLVATVPTVCWLGIGAFMRAREQPSVRRLDSGARARIYAMIFLVTVLVLCFAGSLGFALTMAFSLVSLQGPSVELFSASPVDLGEVWFSERVRDLGVLMFGLAPILLAVFTYLVLLHYRRESLGILVRELAPGQPARVYPTRSSRIERRLARVAASQRGNITVQESNPFIGAGTVTHGWSFAVTLREIMSRITTTGQPDPEPEDPREPVRLDPVALVRHVRAAVLRMRDSALPERERVAGLYLAPHVVADGVRDQDDPLLDPRSGMPYSEASQEALEAIIRSPQGGLRYYERIVVPMGGKRIETEDGRAVLPAQSLGFEVVAFVHLAVEGGRLYTEFMATVLPPVRREYRLPDALHEDQINSRSVRDTLGRFAADTATAPGRLVRGLRDRRRVVSRMDRASLDSQEFRAYDYGARLSVRELAAESHTRKFLQALDGWKYTKLLDRVVSEAIIDFLTDNGVDTTEFRVGVTHVHNNYGGIEVSGGQVNLGGANPTFGQTNDGSASNG